jgi:hypothetical protein
VEAERRGCPEERDFLGYKSRVENGRREMTKANGE